MTDLYNKIVGNRGSLESLMSKIPGFKGYMDMAARREADRAIREHIAGRFKPLIDRLAMIEVEMMNSGGLLHMDKTKSIKTKMDNLRRRIASDTPGYSGFFASNKVDDEVLERIYAFDEAMGGYVDDLSMKLDNLANIVTAGGDGLAATLNELDLAVMEATQAYGLREDILNGIN